MREEIAREIAEMVDRWAARLAAPEPAGRPMSGEEFAAIVKKWGLSALLLQKVLWRSRDTVNGYKFRGRQIPPAVAAKIRWLDAMLATAAGMEDEK